MHDIDRTFMETNMDDFNFQGEEEESESYGVADEVFADDEVEQLAAELLAVSNEDDLDHFLGGLIKKVGQTVGSAIKSPVGRALGGMLKGVVKRALPIAGTALGNMLVPGVGGMLGGKLASAAGSAFGLEIEGLSSEDQQFEIAKQFVRLASDATKAASQTSPSVNPNAAARTALTRAAQRYAPGLLGAGGLRFRGRATSGRWIRRGPHIVLLNV